MQREIILFCLQSSVVSFWFDTAGCLVPLCCNSRKNRTWYLRWAVVPKHTSFCFSRVRNSGRAESKGLSFPNVVHLFVQCLCAWCVSPQGLDQCTWMRCSALGLRSHWLSATSTVTLLAAATRKTQHFGVMYLLWVSTREWVPFFYNTQKHQQLDWKTPLSISVLSFG